MNLANILTVSRLLLLFVIVALFLLEDQFGAPVIWAAFVLYIITAFTDFLDGWIARKFNQITDFGTFLDPISDKIAVSVLLILLVASERIIGLWLIPVILIFTREFLVSGLREYFGPKNIQMPVSKLAKWKTATQLIATIFLIPGPYGSDILFHIGLLLLLIAAILTCVTGWQYLKAGLDHMRKMP